MVAKGDGRLLDAVGLPFTFTVGAVSAGATAGAFLGFLGAWFGGRPLWAILGLLTTAYCVVWYGLQLEKIPLGRERVQANRDMASNGVLGLLSFGAVLGVGVLTQMSTPLVWVGIALSLAHPMVWGAFYGTGFGLGRSLPAWARVTIARGTDAARLATLVVESRRRLRLLGLATAAGSVALGALVLRAWVR